MNVKIVIKHGIQKCEPKQQKNVASSLPVPNPPPIIAPNIIKTTDNTFFIFINLQLLTPLHQEMLLESLCFAFYL